VPVALEGVDLAEVGAPLQALQGFNIRGHEGLNNLISTANDVFEQAHPFTFEAEDYRYLISLAKLGPMRALGKHASHVDVISLSGPRLPNQDASFWTDRYARQPDAVTLLGMHDDDVATLGLRISTWKADRVSFTVDRLAIDSVYPILLSMLTDLASGGRDWKVTVWFGARVYQLENELRISASLIGTGWVPRGKVFSGSSVSGGPRLEFELEWHESEYPGDEDGCLLSVTRDQGIPTPQDLNTVISLCFERGLIFSAEKPSRS
jgi:hypothetical protein